MNLVQHVDVARPVETVFSFLATYENDPTWREGVRSMRVDGPLAVGTTTHEELRFLGATYVTKGVVTEKTATRLAFRGESATVVASGHRQTEVEGQGTRVTYALSLEFKGVMRVFGPLLEPIYARRIRGDLARLKAMLEAT